ncbi:MAG: ComEC/Rec2 family competence protein [Pseudomonadota bacterium]
MQAALPWLLAVLQTRLKADWRSWAGPPDPSRLVLWSPVAFGAGAAIYIGAGAEPPPLFIPIAWSSAAIGLFASILLRGRPWLLYAIALFALAAAGFAHTEQRARAVAPPPVDFVERAVLVEGWIEAVQQSGGRERLIIRVRELSGQSTAPKRVRVRGDLGALLPGDGVRVRAVLSAPPTPAAPGGYDPSRAAWFDSIALTGFAVSALEPVAMEGDRLARSYAAWRWSMAQRFAAGAGKRTGGVAAALLTGERAAVEPGDAEALRVSGLGHILAISGLHMALLAGGAYWAARWVMAAIEPYARAFDPRKPAALIALVSASFYLVLSGAPVSAQRAFIMAAVVLLGVILDRRALSIRSLAIAAMVVLIIAPQSVAEAGFQMSFAAVAALIAVYDAWRRHGPSDVAGYGWFARARRAFVGLAATSFIAGAATGAFAAFHFQRLAAYGLLANLAAMPVFTFWVMPAGAAALAVSAFGLEGPFLVIMDAGLRIVLAIAHWTESLPGAGAGVGAAPSGVIALYGVGFALAMIGRGLARMTGIGVILTALLAWSAASAPAFMITSDGVVLARFSEPERNASGEAGWSASTLRRSRFERRVLLQRAGVTSGESPRAALSCDGLGCVGLTEDGLVLALATSAEALAEDCRRADLIVFAGQVSAYQRRHCATPILDDEDRETLGASEFWVRDGEVVRLRSARPALPDRLWNRSASEGEGR